ncbi:multiple sugar transport system permease protein [Kineococcus xinjiangensis]|uniref:Multiple sugar transport system permease protein n=1 Tax=Kineococcus xinjiangensis TaxID=512762 RepID=A0A2S6IE29_9ACTN|nr:sugar ABC transporter permease [Kineococcus xinjiangensis]PPK92446.1 multiple sugar transport system permease protein [Kineococcus xinjiangensis]
MTALGSTAAAATTPHAPAGPRPRGGGLRGWWGTPWLFLAAPLALLVTFTYVPVTTMVWYSFTSWDGLDATKEPVGLDNYATVLTDREVFGVFLVSLHYLAGALVQMALALYLATVLSFRTRFRNLFKGIVFFPYLVNGVAIGLVFLYFFRPGGTLDALLALAGVGDPPHWLGDPGLVNHSLAATSVWRYLGLNFVLFLGAIQSIPEELYEAAGLDGAGAWQKFRYIIAPGIRPIIGLTFILSISGALSVFEIPYIMTGGANGSSTFVIETVDAAFTFGQVGLASAMAVVLLVVVMVITWVQRRLFSGEGSDLS